jgi:hypothetical protein
LATECGNQPSFEEIITQLENMKLKMVLSVNLQKVIMFVKSIEECNFISWQQKCANLIVFEKLNEQFQRQLQFFMWLVMIIQPKSKSDI